MKYTDRLVSLSILGALALSFAPLASAQGFGGGRFRDQLSDEVRTALQECRDNNENREARRDCAKAVFEANGIERPTRGFGRRGRGRHQFINSLSDEVKEQLQACRDNNEDRSAKHECAKGVLEANGIEKPAGRGHRGRGQFLSNLSDEVKEQLQACRENNDDRSAKKDCMKQVLDDNGIERPARHSRGARHHLRRAFNWLPDEGKEELRACRDEETREEKVACFRAVIEKYKSDTDEE